MKRREVKVIVKEKEFTFTDRLEDESLFPGSKLRNLSQKEWVEETLKHDKIGLIVNNELQLALMHWKRYKEMFEAIQYLKEKNDELESTIEDLEAALNYSKRAERFEQGEAKLITGDTQEEAMENLLKSVYKHSRSTRP